MPAEYYHYHHSLFLEDIPFWIQQTEGCHPVLELGCGTGRVTLPLLDAGRKVIGLEADFSRLQFLKNRISSLPSDLWKHLRLIQADMREFCAPESMGAVILPCNTFSIFPACQRGMLLENITRSLRSQGRLVMSLPNPYHLEQVREELRGEGGEGEIVEEQAIRHPGSGDPILISSQLRLFAGGLIWCWYYDHLSADGGVMRFSFCTEQRIISPGDLQREIERKDLKVRLMQGDYQGATFEEDSPYLVVTAEKV